MNKDELAPHVKEIARVLGNKVDESRIEEELENYLNVYRVSLETAKRSVVKNFGGDPNGLSKGNRRKVADIKGGEQSVDVAVKVITANPKDIEVDGKPRSLVYGLMADETGTIAYSLWDPQRIILKPGEVVLVRNAYSKEYNGRVDLNLGNRANVEVLPQDAVVVDMSVSAPTSYGAGEVVKVAQLADGMNNVTVTARILSVERKEVGEGDTAKVVYQGMMADDTGKVQFSSWHDFDLKPNEVVKVSKAYVKGWKGVPKLNFGERAMVVRLPESSMPDVVSSRPKPRTIEDVERVGGATDALIIGTIVDVKEGSGLIRRCPQCKRVVQKGACRLHGKVDGFPDLRVKAVLDDGNASLTAVMNRPVTESLLGMNLDECVRQAKEAMNTEVIRELVEDKLLARPLELRGNVLSDEYGLMMIVSDASSVRMDVQAKAAEILANVEGFQ
jgi:replication factor A1